MLDYDAYVALFNTGDDAALVDRFFHEDIVFTGGSRLHRGKAALLGFLEWAHDGVREIIRLQRKMCDGDTIFVEVDMDFVASKPRTDFPFGDLMPGDIRTVKFFVTYRIRDGRIIELKSMTWPPEWGVTKAPKLGAHPGQRAAYLAYAEAFSTADMERAASYYTDDVTLVLPSAPRLVGKRAVVDFYQAMFRQVRERVTVHHMTIDDGGIAADVTSTFTAVDDAPDFPVMPMARRDAIAVPVIVFYRLRDGLIYDIHVTRNGTPEHVPAATLEKQ
jgi:ketosteroid isomerase-like protein